MTRKEKEKKKEQPDRLKRLMFSASSGMGRETGFSHPKLLVDLQDYLPTMKAHQCRNRDVLRLHNISLFDKNWYC